ncbi:MAG: hypothetical protein ABSC19_00020 [Syntrophorhabdales bacterium]|jgi:hypothetical protein
MITGLVRARFRSDFAPGSAGGGFGRLGEVVEGPDGLIHMLTNNGPGRGV